MITSDYNFVNVDFYFEYQITDPVKYFYASEEPEVIVKNLAQSYIRDTVGSHKVDEVLTTGKYEIQSEIKAKLQERLDEILDKVKTCSTGCVNIRVLLTFRVHSYLSLHKKSFGLAYKT